MTNNGFAVVINTSNPPTAGQVLSCSTVVGTTYTGTWVTPGTGISISQITANLGATPATNGNFTITGNFTVGKFVIITQAPGLLGDEVEFDQIVATAFVLNATTIQVNWGSSTAVSGNYNFNYFVGN
jgi:hypothetical protein